MSGRPARRPLGRLLPALAPVVLAGGLAVVLGIGTAPDAGGKDNGRSVASAGGDPVLLTVPAPVEPAFVPHAPKALGPGRHVSRFAPVVRATTVHAAPAAASEQVARLDTSTPEGTRNIVLVVGRAKGADERLWVRVRLPVLPNNTVAWVPRSALGGYGAVTTRLVVDLAKLRATLYRSGLPVFEADVGAGEAEWPTPRGEFYVRNRLTRYANAFYGPVAFGTSARSDVLTDWPAGGFVGIHGTNRPDLLPGRVSHGCIRLRNDDILRLARLMPVGTPLTIR
jgi:lipoprotein-anchoring transpeptidase ErfK/SrfK